MYSFPKRARHLTRLAVGLVALGATVMGSSVAIGAMGTSRTIASALPDFTSATIVDPQIVRYCFDRTINTVPGAGDPGDRSDYFEVGGYNQDDYNEAVDVGTVDNFCVDATFTGGIELSKYSHAQVDGGGVIATVSGVPRPNLGDSRPLIGTDGENGTRGRTTGNDLISAFTTPTGGGGGTITYLTDQVARVTSSLCALDAPTGSGTAVNCSSNDFFFYDLQGTRFDSDFVQAVSGNNIRAHFTDPVGNALIVGFQAEAQAGTGFIEARTPESGNGSADSLRTALSSVDVVTPTGSRTNRADLISNELVLASGIPTGQVDFNYDEAVVSPFAPDYTVWSSERDMDTGNTASLLNSNTTVRINFDSDSGQQTEFYVRASAEFGAADDADVAGNNATGGGKPLGGNALAKHTGYSTGPDAQGPLTVLPGESAVRFQADQRVDPNDVCLSCIELVDSQGNEVGNANGLGVDDTGAPGPAIVTVTFDSAGDLTNAVGLRLDDGAMTSLDGPFSDEENVDQIFGP